MQTKKHKAFISIFAIFFSAIIVSVLIALFVLLVKQIQLLSLDSSSFQAFYTADSAAECAIAQEKKAAAEAYEYSRTSSGTPKFVWDTTVFRSENWSNFQGCANTGDIVKDNQPQQVANNQTQADFKLKLQVDGSSEYCGFVTVIRNLKDQQNNNKMSATGRSTSCSDTSNTKVVEREVQVEY